MSITKKNQSINEVISKVLKKNKNCSPQNIIKPAGGISKKQLWEKFQQIFYSMFGKNLIQDGYTINNLKVLFFYFLQDNEFFKCENLRADITIPSFQKGLLIIGGYGLGKTDYFTVFEEVFKGISKLRFKYYAAKNLVLEYEHCKSAYDKEYFFKAVSRPKMFIDDLMSERMASNYGKVDVIQDVLMQRYNKRLITYASCNYNDSDFCAKSTLENIGLRYGPRIYDRLFEMFNIIEFKGKSLRK